MASSRSLLVAILAVSSSILVACAPSSGEPEPVESSAVSTVVVETRDITAALTFPVTVTAGLDYDVTSPTDGKFVLEGSNLRVQNSASSEDVTVPTGSVVQEVLVADGQDVAVGLPLLRAEASGFILKAAVDPKLLPRLTNSPTRVRAQLEGGSAAFDCPLLNPLPTFGDDGGAYYGCTVPPGTPLVEGMTGRLVLVLAEAKQVLALPIAAVSGTVGRGEVASPGGQVKPVMLGITDGQYIEIKSGLSADDRVQLPAPSLLDSP